MSKDKPAMVILALTAGMSLLLSACEAQTKTEPVPQASEGAKAPSPPFDTTISSNVQRMMDEGRRVFRSDTFGSEAFWGDALKLYQAISGEKLGGVGTGVSPKTALSVGLK